MNQVKLRQLKAIAERKKRTLIGDSYKSGYLAGKEDVKQEILEILNEEITLDRFVSTMEGSRIWDSKELRIVLDNKTVFILIENEYVKMDTINLLKQEVFTKKSKELIVEDHKIIDEINYLFVKEIKEIEGIKNG